MLAPKIIFDKCTLRGLKTSQIPSLLRHLDLLLPPILLREIATELSKDREIPEKIESMARSLAEKACSSRADVIPDIDVLIFNELLHQPLMLSSKQISKGYPIFLRSKDGSQGVFFDEAVEMALLRRWKNEDFSENDFKESFLIRQDHEMMVREYPQKKKGGQAFTSLNQILEWINNHHFTKNNQELIISTVSSYLPEDKAQEALTRWNLEGCPDIHDYAPFCVYFYKLTAIYILAGQSQIIGTGKDSKPHLDIQYLYYLPFCDVFATDDDDVRNIATLLKRSDQIITNKDELIKEIGELTAYEKSKLPRNAISRRPSKDCPSTIIQKAWTSFAGEWRQEASSLSDNLEQQNSNIEALAQFKMMESSIIVESNLSHNPIYTEEFDKLSLSQKNLIVYDQITEIFDRTLITSKITNFFNLYGDLWRPDSNLKIIFQSCSCTIPKPLWMYDGNESSLLEYHLMLPYFNQILTIDPVPNPWNIKHDFNPINNPNSYMFFFDELRVFYTLISEALYSKQMLIVPHIEDFVPQIAWDFGQSEKTRCLTRISTDEENKEKEANAMRMRRYVKFFNVRTSENEPLLSFRTPTLENSILLSRLTGSIPITSFNS